MKDKLQIQKNPMALEQNIVQGKDYRFTVLTDRMIRMEYAANGSFEDRASQVVLNRDFPAVEFKVTENPLTIQTKALTLTYLGGDFTKDTLQIQMTGTAREAQTDEKKVWHYGDRDTENLGGTVRTLDEVNGACKLEDGLFSGKGYAVYDDSHTLVIREDGFVERRAGEGKDVYFFGFGTDYLGGLKEFYRLTGKTPMLPRYALGNWWSRYYSYSEESYKALMEKFEEYRIPFTVAVIDMDWHPIDIPQELGGGWTGFSWNKDLFPDPPRFLKWLHDRGMHTTLNLHPADGIRSFEDCYPALAKSMGIDPESGETVEFDASNPTFVENYFKHVCNPMEEEGVDFWWIDWQQGTKTKVEGLDPLWILNHFHYLDSGRDGKRPMTFSRYAGPGSHRYPIGFSGDTVISWDSLQFQPYFTSTASNIGYGWWSHDIGGHTYGGKNDEMEARWYQYGVFSPIMRLHSTKNEFNGKEPWRFKKEARDTMIDFLQLRHKLIPYLYTMNYRAYEEDAPIVEPLNYVHGPKDIFEKVPNEYYFGTEMIVSPITTKRIDGLNLACQKTWLPKGVFYDFFSGMHYEIQEEEGKLIENFRDINSIPVFVKAGSILPMVEKLDAASVIRNPEELVLRVYLGADGAFTLYEDDNDTTGYLAGAWAKTKITLDEKAKTLKIHPVDGDASILPAKRKIKVEFVGYDTGKNVVELEVEPKEGAVITWNREEKIVNPYKEAIFDLLNQAEITFKDKQEIYDLVEAAKDYTELKRVLDEKTLDFEEPEILKAAVLEICSLM